MARKPKGRRIDGIFLLNKSAGMSSNKALQQIKHLYGAEKAGHTGALDPLATGMLPICLGEATKFSQYLLDSDKSYVTTAKLGVRTTTSDAEGDIVETRPVPDDLTQERVEALLVEHFSGEIEQVPSMYSALKLNGQPLYKLARQGIEVEVKSRRVTIHSIRLLALRADEIDLEVSCSKGTYIRSIVEDLGQLLGCGAHVKALHRLTTGHFTVEMMRTQAELQAYIDEQMSENPEQSYIQNALDTLLLPAWSAIADIPELTLSADQTEDILYGRRVRLDVAVSSEFRLFDTLSGRFLGLGETDETGLLKGKRLIRSDDV